MGNVVVEADVVVPNLAVPNRAKTEGDRLAVLSPDEVAMPIRHALASFKEIFPRENFEFDRCIVRNAEIKRMNFIDHLATVG